jgi:hypothetical protein
MTTEPNLGIEKLEDGLLGYQGVSEDLIEILKEMSDESNLGAGFSKKDYFNLFLFGLFIPALLMIGGWFL